MNNYEIPAIGFSEAAARNLGKYGRMRKQYLQAHRTGLYNSQQPAVIWDTVYTPVGNRPDSPQTLGTDMGPRLGEGRTCSFAGTAQNFG